MVSKPRVRRTRARSEVDKVQHRELILDAAKALWDGRPFADIGMNEVARAAGLAKGTLYLYVQTKEELFLAVLKRHLWPWFAELEARLDASATGPGPVAALMTASLLGRGRMVHLLSILSNVLEQNLALDAGLAFKARLARQLASSGPRLEARLPGGSGARLLLHVNAYVVGLHQVTAPTPVLRAAQDPALGALALDFGAELRFGLTALLGGALQGDPT